MSARAGAGPLIDRPGGMLLTLRAGRNHDHGIATASSDFASFWRQLAERSGLIVDADRRESIGSDKAMVHRKRRNTWALELIVVLGIAAAAGFALKRHLEAPDAAVQAGRAEFARYCAECHGDGGRGDGPRAGKLARHPPDLTLLAARNGGTFRARDIRDFIDGRGFEKAHGDREMPIWGRLLNGREDGSAEDLETQRRVRIEHLVIYLWSLQRSPTIADSNPQTR